MRTEIPSQAEIVRAWHVIDADAAVLGRVASRAAMLLMGKHKPMYAPSIDTGDHVVVINAAKVRLTGGKEGQKLYRRHSGYPGGLVETGARRMRETRPERMVELAISGMLPRRSWANRCTGN
jgi:large subunit ribosomal protein L13